MKPEQYQRAIEIQGRLNELAEVKKAIQGDQKKFIGNAVEVTTSRRLCEALAERITV